MGCNSPPPALARPPFGRPPRTLLRAPTAIIRKNSTLRNSVDRAMQAGVSPRDCRPKPMLCNSARSGRVRHMRGAFDRAKHSSSPCFDVDDARPDHSKRSVRGENLSSRFGKFFLLARLDLPGNAFGTDLPRFTDFTSFPSSFCRRPSCLATRVPVA